MAYRLDLDDYDGPLTAPRPACGCPEHDQPEADEAEIADLEALYAWQDANEPTITPED